MTPPSMLRPRWHKVISDLWGNKVRSLLVVASIAVGLFAVGIIVTNRVLIADDMRTGYAAVNPANIQITVASFDQDLVDHIQHLEGVRNAEGIFVTSLRAKTGSDEWTAISMKAYTHFDKMKINQLKVVEGKFPPEKDEIVVDRNKFSDLNAHIGDWIEIELPSGNTRKLLLVGIIHDQTIGASGVGGGFFLAPVQGYISNKTLAHLELPDIYNQLNVTVTGNSNDETHIGQVAEQVRKEIEASDRSVINTLVRRSDEHPNATYVDAISGVLLLLGLFVVFLSAFLVTNTISALLAQQGQQIGIMKTVGARRYQVVTIYMTVIFIYGVLACLIAIPLSYLAANSIIDFLALKINFTVQEQHIVPISVILQILIALGVPQIAGFVPILHASRISVQEAISGIQQVSHAVKRGWLDNRVTQIKGISRPMVISMRNAFRRKGRLALTLLTLSLGGAVFIATFNVRASLDQHIAQVGKYFLADVNLTLDRPYRIDRIEQELNTLPEVSRLEGWSQARVTMIMKGGSVGESISILAPPVNSSLIEPVLISGRWIKPGDTNAIVLSERFLSQFPDIQLEDTIKLKIKDKDTEWVVVGFFQLAGKSGGFLAYTSYDYFSELIGEANKAVAYRIVASRTGLTSDEQNQLVKVVESHLKKDGFHITDISAGSKLSNSSSGGLNVLTVFLMIMAVLMALVGGIGLAGTMGMNVMERTREIGVMRAIGASDWMVSRMVLLEGVIIGLVSWAIGSLLSIPISKLMSDTINLAIFDATSGFTFTSTGLLIWLVFVLILSVLASLLPARNASRLTIREVLAYE